MFRRTTARTVVSLLAAVLLALQLFSPTASFAAAHTARHTVAKALPGTKPSGVTPRDEAGTQSGCGHPGDPTGPLRTRDRHVNTGCTSDEPDRPLLAQDPASAHQPAAPGALHLPRHTAARTPAALQVFRC